MTPQVKRAPLKIQEEDGSPSGFPRTLKVANGTLTDNGDGTFSLASGGGGGDDLTWDFSTTTTDGDPGANTFRYNNATPASVTQIFIDDVATSAVDAGSMLDALRPGDHVYIEDGSDSSKNQLFEIDGATVNGTGYRKLQVAHVTGGTLPGNTQTCNFRFLTTSGVWYTPTTISAKTTTYTTTAADHYVPCDANSGAFTVTLHTAAAENDGQIVIIQNVNSTNNNALTIDFGGTNNVVLVIENEFVLFRSDGLNWRPISDGRIPVVARLQLTTAQGIANATVDQIEFDDADIDNASATDTSTTWDFTTPRASRWFCGVWWMIDSAKGVDDGEGISAYLVVSGSQQMTPTTYSSATDQGVAAGAFDLIDVAANVAVRMDVWHNSGEESDTRSEAHVRARLFCHEILEEIK